MRAELGNGQLAIGELLQGLLPKLGARRSLGTVHGGTPGFEGTKPTKLPARARCGLTYAHALFTQLQLGIAREGGAGTLGVAESRLACRWIYCDSGHLPEVVFDAAKAVNAKAVRELVLPILGRGETQMSKRRYTAPTGKGATIRKIDRDGRWHLSRVSRARIDQLTLDADVYKRLADGGFRSPAGSPGAITLFSGPGTVHRTFIRHQINEQFVTEELPDQAPISKWICTGANHYKDALAYAICAATRLGWSPTTDERPQKVWPD